MAVADLGTWTKLMSKDSNGLLRLVNLLAFAMVLAHYPPEGLARIPRTAMGRFLALLGRHGLTVFVWSLLATYLSAWIMPRSPDAYWRVADLLLSIGTLCVPAALQERLRLLSRAAEPVS